MRPSAVPYTAYARFIYRYYPSIRLLVLHPVSEMDTLAPKNGPNQSRLMPVLCYQILKDRLVPLVGLEPTRLSAIDFESIGSAIPPQRHIV